MTMKSAVTAIGLGLLIIGLDYYVITIWQWILEHNMCDVRDANGVTMQTICWGTNPTPFFVINVVAIGLTLGYLYQIYRTIRGDSNE